MENPSQQYLERVLVMMYGILPSVFPEENHTFAYDLDGIGHFLHSQQKKGRSILGNIEFISRDPNPDLASISVNPLLEAVYTRLFHDYLICHYPSGGITITPNPRCAEEFRRKREESSKDPAISKDFEARAKELEAMARDYYHTFSRKHHKSLLSRMAETAHIL